MSVENYAFSQSLPGLSPVVEEEEPLEGSIQADKIGKTALDRIHQSMLLFASGRSDALKRFLVDDGVGKDYEMGYELINDVVFILRLWKAREYR